jgi:hypothetical protein
LILSEHAKVVVAERAIQLAWIEMAIALPDASGQDPSDPTLAGIWKRISEADGRALRVVYRALDTDILIVTAFFDRGARL